MNTKIKPVTPRPGPKPSGNARGPGVRVPLTDTEKERAAQWADATDTRMATWMREKLMHEVEAWERAERRRHRTSPA